MLFRVDPAVKTRATRRARQEGIPLGVVLKFATKAYANGELNLGITQSPEILNEKTVRQLAGIDRDIRLKKNLSPVVDDVESFLNSLRAVRKSRR